MEVVEKIFNHVVLPPRLPEEQDADIDVLEQNLIGRLLAATQTLQETTPAEFHSTWAALESSLTACRSLNHETLDRLGLAVAFRTLLSKKNHVLICHLAEQNAALLVHRRVDGVVVFEAFEASPQIQDVLAAPNALLWTFPSRASQISAASFDNENFQTALASFLEKASCEQIIVLAAQAKKAGTLLGEVRNPGSPALITHMLLTMLEAMGGVADVEQLHKRVRDDVLHKNGDLPWRRLPFWLVLRVAIRRQLQLALGPEDGKAAYKLLVCVLLAKLLQDTVVSHMNPSLVDLLKKKLCRRLAKIQPATAHGAGCVLQLLVATDAIFRAAINASDTYIQTAFAEFKASTARKVPYLPQRIGASEGLRLTLPSSFGYLQHLVSSHRSAAWKTKKPLALAMGQFDGLLADQSNDSGIRKMQRFGHQYLGIEALMKSAAATIEASFSDITNPDTTSEVFPKIVSALESLLKDTTTMHAANPEYCSALLLTVFSLWATMDSSACTMYPLVRKFAPPFSAPMLDVLHLPNHRDMTLLRSIQRYLHQRQDHSKFKDRTIFGPLDEQCFGACFATASPDLTQLIKKIRRLENKNRESKTKEWKEAGVQYDHFSMQILAHTCRCTVDVDGKRNVSGCVRCYNWRQRKKMKIAVCEDLLPREPGIAAAVVCELAMPAMLSTYRNTTWKVLSSFAYPTVPILTGKTRTLSDYQPLRSFLASHAAASPVTIASFVKAVGQTHYKHQSVKVDIDCLFVPLASRFRLYDSRLTAWVEDFSKPLTLAHWCGIYIPKSLVDTVIPKQLHPNTWPDGPSSYAAVSNRPQCPAGVSVHEFEAYQRLLSGKERRWLTMLVELGSSNLNFSTDDTTQMLSHLANQAGPASSFYGGGDKTLGVCHAIFTDTSFLERLVGEIERHLGIIRDNWNEFNTMELLITLILRVFNLAKDPAFKEKALDLMQSVRTTTLGWIETLKIEVTKAVDGHAAERASFYAFRSALLCRRVLAVFDNSHKPIGPHNISSYIRASVALQQNLVVDVDTLSAVNKARLQRDLSMATTLREKIRAAITSCPRMVDRAIACSIGLCHPSVLAEGHEEREVDFECTPWKFLPRPNVGWMTSTLSKKSNGGSQRVDFHFIEGHLLIDGKTVGKLPQDIRDSEDVKELFGSQHLLTYPSAMPGMSHRLVGQREDHEVHFGMRNGHVVIMTIDSLGTRYEHVPRQHFISSTGAYDLPLNLVDNHAHWFNQSTGCIEFRLKTVAWKMQKHDWWLDIKAQQMQRNRVLLVDPHAAISRTIASIFRHFEDPQRLTIFQPLHSRGCLSVELRHLDLLFEVNTRGLLICAKLDAEIDPDQDAGTLYGYQSMIVLRNMDDRSRRSIIAPLGKLLWKREGPHISVINDIGQIQWVRGRGAIQGTAADKAYIRYTIDTVLGRLACPPEPRLLYTKAQLHAFTSCPLVDPLTGRTGEEEAVQTLISGRCQPWEPLPVSFATIFQQMQALAPRRQYYPKDMRVLQHVSWDSTMPVGLQHDRYGRLIRELLTKSDNLKHFHESAAATSLDGEAELKANEVDDASSTLTIRGEVQRLRFESPVTDPAGSLCSENKDRQYTSLGCRSGPPHTDGPKTASYKFNTAAVFQVTKMVRDRATKIPMTRSLSSILNDWALIGGYNTAMDPDLTSISTLMDVQTMGERWGTLVKLFGKIPNIQEAEILVVLSILAFSPGVDMDCVHLLAAYSYLPGLYTLEPPVHKSYNNFQFQETPSQDRLEELIALAYVAYKIPEQRTQGWSSALAEYQRACERHATQCKNDGRRLAQMIRAQWPEKELQRPWGFITDKIDVDVAMSKIQPEWDRLQQNLDLTEYVKAIEDALQPYCVARMRGLQKVEGTMREALPGELVAVEQTIVPSFSRDLLLRDMPRLWSRAPESKTSAAQFVVPLNLGSAVEWVEITELRQIVSSFSTSSTPLRQDYARDLTNSIAALVQKNGEVKPPRERMPSPPELAEKIQASALNCIILLDSIRRTFCGGHNAAHLLQQAGLWPRLTVGSVLELLRSKAGYSYGANVRETLVAYGCAVAEQQRLQRVQRIMKKDGQRALEEWRNRGHENWKPEEQTDWLLFEIDGDVLIRAEQVEVARAIIAPASGANSVLQLNMGKGKTSCIVPMAIAALADGKQLARLVVPKALLLPTAQMVQARLGGLVGRELRHVPFSRRLATGGQAERVLKVFRAHHEDLMAQHGVLLAAPEHILAFQLSGQQCLADGRTKEAQEMMAFQQRLTDTMCRDVLDESDFSLGVRTQLVYPSGSLSAVDGAPHRWKLAQAVLAMVEENLPRLCQEFPGSIQSIPRQGGGFPMVCILRMDVAEEMHRLVVNDISTGRVPFFRPVPQNRVRKWHSLADTSTLLRRALGRKAMEADIEMAAERFADAKVVADGLRLVRGLLLNDILLVCLRKRWNVQYGLHPTRDPIAVPFEAKGVPSERSEFGHPDVAILFTCLAFYYAGLSPAQFTEGLGHVLQHTDDPAAEYERWTSGAITGPGSYLPPWNMVNVDDMVQMKRLWTNLARTRPVIDHYLNTFVFPLHARQFSVKLQASAWDLPLFRPKAFKAAKGSKSGKHGKSVKGRGVDEKNVDENVNESGGARTTGFSGTNDNKMMLPLTIRQDDLPGQQQTNAEVLTYLLQQRNRQCVRTADGSTRWSEEELLCSLKAEGIRVLIDAGAYILEKGNEALARQWLTIDKGAEGAVYFDTDNRAWVLFRDSTVKKMPLVASPFVDRLGDCLVYFDEAHTRGVDLPLPPQSRGALTLALGQTKDHTVQAAMRLRQLGTSQSIVFYAPPEVDDSIRDVCRRQLTGNMKSAAELGGAYMNSAHVICWLLEQTCLANEQLHPLYLAHGHDFCQRAGELWRQASHLENDQARKALLDVLRQPERQTIEQLYAAGGAKKAVPKQRGGPVSRGKKAVPPQLEAFMAQLWQHQPNGQPGNQVGAETEMPTAGAFEEVEQEREVEVQVEQVRAKQRRVVFEALSFPGVVHPNIRNFVSTGVLVGKRGYGAAYLSMAQTAAGQRHGLQAEWSTRLFVSSEFDRTVSVENLLHYKDRDDFLRPVEWVLWSPTTATALVVVPEELELLLPTIRAEKRVHVLAYAAPVTRSMAAAFSSLQFLALPALGQALPPWLVVEVGILAGRLYMSYSEATAMAEYVVGLGKGGEGDQKTSPALCANPATFLLDWLALRRVGQDILHTPAAYVCQGRPLRADHPFFASARGQRSSSSTEDEQEAIFSEDETESSSESGKSGGGEAEETQLAKELGGMGLN